MKTSLHVAAAAVSALVAAVLAASCAAQCAKDDLECITQHLRLYGKDGRALPLTGVPASSFHAAPSSNGTACTEAIQCCSGECTNGICAGTTNCTGDGKGCTNSSECCSGICEAGDGDAGTVCAPTKCAGQSGAPAIFLEHPPNALVFDSRYEYSHASIHFSDACGQTPGGCFHVRPRGTVPGPFWSVDPTQTVVTTPSVDDGLSNGLWEFQIGFDFEPTDESAQFTLDIYGRSQCEGQDGLSVGDPISADIEVKPPPKDTGGGNVCPDGHPCNDSGHVCCKQGDGSYACLLPGLCQ